MVDVNFHIYDLTVRSAIVIGLFIANQIGNKIVTALKIHILKVLNTIFTYIIY